MSNKVKFGLENVYIAILEENEEGVLVPGTPKHQPGAVTLTTDPDGDEEVFYADNVKYHISRANNGYTGSLEMAIVSDWFRQNVLGEVKNTDGVLIEVSNAETKPFVLLHQIEGDSAASKVAFYNCTASRPSRTSSTATSTNSPNTETFDFSALPRTSDKVIKATADKDSTPYADWFDSVYEPALTTGTTGE